MVDDYGNTWYLGRSLATTSFYVADGAGYAVPTTSMSGNYIDAAVQDAVTSLELAVQAVSSGFIEVRRDINASNYINAGYQHHPSRMLSLLSVSNGATTLHASQALASLALSAHHELALRTLGGQGIVTLRRTDGATVFLAGPTGVTVASIGASHANLNRRGNPGMRGINAGNETQVFSIRAQSIPSNPCNAYDTYQLAGNTTRSASGGDINGILDGDTTGRLPKPNPPSGVSLAALVTPLDQGATNDTLALAVRATERFTFLR